MSALPSWFRHRCRFAASLVHACLPLCLLAAGLACKVHAEPATTATTPVPPKPAATECLPKGAGFLRARISGAIRAELNWGNSGLLCTGAVRPTDGGIRVTFSQTAGSEKLMIVFGIAHLNEGATARALPVNLTLVREGRGEFFSTQGDDKCTLDEVRQEPLTGGIPRLNRSYRIVARGFCIEPARSVTGTDSILLSRFDFSGRVDYTAEDTATHAH
jgi:hypothetical protein